MIGLATGALVTAVWQGVLLAVVVGLALRLLPKTPAAVRFAIWFAVFAVVTVLPLVSLWPRAAGVAGGGHVAWLTLDMRWSLAIAAVWAGASLVRAATLAVAAFRVRALWKRATAVTTWQGVSPWSTTSNMGHPGSRRAQLCVSDEVDRPTVIGFFAPKIVIPSWLLEKLTPAELEQIVLHESGHLGRADDWMNLMQKIALVNFPLNPALAWVERRLCFERELAVDERVLKAFAGRTGAAKAYAACLATVAEHRLQKRGLALALGALGRESELGQRVGRILKRGEAMRPAHAKLILGCAMLGLTVAAVGLERCPQVVGFASAAAQQTASVTPQRAEDGLVRGSSRGSYQAVSLRLKVQQTRYLQEDANVPHEVLVKSPAAGAGLKATRVSEAPEFRDLVAAESQPALREETVKDRQPATLPSQAPSYSTASAQGRSTRMVQWVVVTSWRDEDGSRVVLTTASLPNGIGPAATDGGQAKPAAGDRAVPSQTVPSQAGLAQAIPSEDFHPYAAVPVRGGWLVFQL